jgi:phenylacetate-CoA ligase
VPLPAELPEIPDILAFLKTVDPLELERMGEDAMLEAFQSAAAEVPAYRDLLTKRGVDPVKVTDLASLRQIVPLIDKSLVFEPYSIEDLCRHGSLAEIKGILPSSGHSGVFAFSVNTLKNIQNTARMVDLALEYCLKISAKRTLLVNTYPMGVNVHTSLPVANTGVNADIALAVVKKFASAYEQLVLVGQPLFAKHLVEEGAQQGIDWAGLNTSVVTGGEGFSESWRTYMSGLIGIKDPDRPTDRFVASSMGIGEVDLNVFHEIPDTIRIVRAAYRYRPLRYALFGEGVDVPPLFFIYYPMRTFVEEVALPDSPVGELAISLLSPDIRNPLIRYKTGDRIKVLPYKTLERILAQHGGIPAPALHMPTVMVFGRTETVGPRNGLVHAETVKEAVFRDPDVAAATTGFFKISAPRGALRIQLQLREGVKPVRRLQRLLEQSIEACLPRKPFVATVHGFNDYPYSTSYERKYRYIDKKP